MSQGLSAAGMARAFKRGRQHISREVTRDTRQETQDVSMTLLESIRRENLKCAWRFLEIGERACATRHIRAAIVARQQMEKLDFNRSKRSERRNLVASVASCENPPIDV